MSEPRYLIRRFFFRRYPDQWLYWVAAGCLVVLLVYQTALLEVRTTFLELDAQVTYRLQGRVRFLEDELKLRERCSSFCP